MILVYIGHVGPHMILSTAFQVNSFWYSILRISYIQDIQDVYLFESILSNTKNECIFLHNEITQMTFVN